MPPTNRVALGLDVFNMGVRSFYEAIFQGPHSGLTLIVIAFIDSQIRYLSALGSSPRLTKGGNFS